MTTRHYTSWETWIVCLKENKEIALIKHKELINESNQWRKTAETIFRPIVSKIDSVIKKCKIEALPSSTRIDFHTYSRANEINVCSKIKEHLEQNKSVLNAILVEKGISNLWYIPDGMSSITVYLFRNNLYARIPIYKNYSETIPVIANVVYGAFSVEDIIEISSEDNSFKLDVSIPPTEQKSASVMGRMLVGHLIGGAVGGFLGAASAVEKNTRDAFYRANYEPIVIDAKYKEIIVRTYWDIHMEDGYFEIDLGKSDDSADYIEKFLTTYQTAKSQYELAEGDLLKKYVSEHPGDFKESAYQEFIEQIKQKIYEEEKKAKEERRIEYWSKHLSEKEALESEKVTLDKELIELEQQLAVYDKRRQEIEKENSREITAETESNQIKRTIEDLEKARNSLGLFKGKEKKLISAKIIDLSNKLDVLDGEISNQKKCRQPSCKNSLIY